MRRLHRVLSIAVMAMMAVSCAAQLPQSVPSAAGGDGRTYVDLGAMSPPVEAARTSSPMSGTGPVSSPANTGSGPTSPVSSTAGDDVIPAVARPPAPSYTFTLALAGDVNFAERTADLLAADPDTALREAADQLSRADLTMVNLETAITEAGSPAPKQFHFRAPATALDALAAGGVDIATMANNHAVDYGADGLADSLDALQQSPIPVLGIGRTANDAYAPYFVTVNGVRAAFLAASQVHDYTTSAHTAGPDSPGIAATFDGRIVDEVRAAAEQADVVIVYLHWGVEYDSCPSAEQRSLADELAAAGATAVVGTHAHVLQGAGWRDDGVYVAYGLGNYYWWRSFGNMQDDNGVLTLTFNQERVVAADFLATRLDALGVPQVADGEELARIEQQWEENRLCADLAETPPAP